MGSRAAAPIPGLSRRVTAAICLALVGCALAIQWPYLVNGHAFDDWDYLEAVAQLETGERTPVEYLLTPYNEHLFPAWRAWYYGCWRQFGFAPAGWHVGITLAHGLGAAMLFLVLQAYAGWGPALVGAGMWAVAGIGGWENPLSWISASDLAFGTAWLLAAMVCLTRYRTSSGWRWPALMGAAMVMAVAWMSAMWTLLPVLALQWWFLERLPDEGRLPRRAWLVAWLVPWLALAGPAVAAALGYFGEVPAGTTDSDVAVGLYRTAAAWELALERLVWPFEWGPPALGIALRAGLGAALFVLVFIWPGANRRLLVPLLALAIGYTLLVQVARSESDVNYALTMGRYNYLPVLGWCAALAALVSAPWCGGVVARFRPIAVAALLAVGALFVWQQVATVRGAVYEFAGQTANSRYWFDDSGRVLDFLAEAGRQRGRPVRLVDFTWRCPPGEFSLRQYLAITKRGAVPGLEIVPASAWTAADYDEFAATIAGTEHTMRWALVDALAGQRQIVALAAALQANAAAKGRVLAFPDVDISQPQALFTGQGERHPPRAANDPDYGLEYMTVKLGTLVERLFGGALANVRFVPAEEQTEAVVRDAIAELGRIDQPYARALAEALGERLKGEAKRVGP